MCVLPRPDSQISSVLISSGTVLGPQPLPSPPISTLPQRSALDTGIVHVCPQAVVFCPERLCAAGPSAAVASRQYSRLLAGWYVATLELAAAFVLTRRSVWGYLLGRKDAGLDLVQIASHLGVFLFGSTILHSAICVINDILDKDLDGQVGAHRHRLCIPNR
jgi:hypothetical protein